MPTASGLARPGSHPHTGQQLLLGAQAIAGGGWFGATACSAWRRWARTPARRCAFPAVQDDFAPSFFLNRHGLAARPAAVAAAGPVPGRAAANRAALLAGGRRRATSAWPGWALPLLPAVRRRGLRVRPLPAVVGHQPGDLSGHGPAHELPVGGRLAPAVFHLPPASVRVPQAPNHSRRNHHAGLRPTRNPCKVNDVFNAEAIWQAPGLALFSRRPLLRDLLERAPREQRGRAATRCFSHVTLMLPQEEVDDDRHLTRGARVRDLAQAWRRCTRRISATCWAATTCATT
jgi:hypothetical protein